MSVTAYSTDTQLEQILSPFGVTVRADDDDNATKDTGILTAIHEQAATLVNQYLFPRGYAVAAISASTWAAWCAATIGARLLCRRRGNPVPDEIEQEYEQYIAQLTAIRNGQQDLIGDTGLATPAFDMLPVVSNLTVDGRYRRSKIRRIPTTSTGTPPSGNVKSFPTNDYGPNL